MFRYNEIKETYELYLEQLKETTKESRKMFNTSITILPIEITLLSGLIFQNYNKIQRINPYLNYTTVTMLIITLLLTLLSIIYFNNSRKINEEVIPIDKEIIKILFKENNNFEEDTVYLIETTRKAIEENSIINENKTVYIEKGFSCLMIILIIVIIIIIMLIIII